MPITIDTHGVDDEDEATDLMLHHLMLAASYFEATRDDHGSFARVRAKEKLGPEAAAGAVAFISAIDAQYGED